MIWNFARIKITLYGAIATWVGVLSCVMITQAKAGFTPYEYASLYSLMIIIMLIGIFMVFYGIEEIMPDIKTGKDREQEQS